jgi:uncharacterized membrane protein YgcG
MTNAQRQNRRNLSNLLLLALVCMLFVPALPVQAQQVPYLSGRVNDYAEILSAQTS